MSREIEIKLMICKVEARDIKSVLSSALGPLVFTEAMLENRYFDTPDLALNKARIALRVRRKQKQFIQTLKTKGEAVDGLHRRGEWEWNLGSPELDVSLLQACDAWPQHIDANALVPVFETNFKRWIAYIDVEGARIEIAYDKGAILLDGAQAPIHEIELELVSGTESALLGLSKELQQFIRVEPYDISKAERGYELYYSANQ